MFDVLIRRCCIKSEDCKTYGNSPEIFGDLNNDSMKTVLAMKTSPIGQIHSILLLTFETSNHSSTFKVQQVTAATKMSAFFFRNSELFIQVNGTISRRPLGLSAAPIS